MTAPRASLGPEKGQDYTLCRALLLARETQALMTVSDFATGSQMIRRPLMMYREGGVASMAAEWVFGRVAVVGSEIIDFDRCLLLEHGIAGKLLVCV